MSERLSYSRLNSCEVLIAVAGWNVPLDPPTLLTTGNEVITIVGIIVTGLPT